MDERSLINNKYINRNVFNIQGDMDRYLNEQAKFRQYHENKNKTIGNLNFSTSRDKLKNVVEDSENIIDLLDSQKPMINGNLIRENILSGQDYLSNNLISYVNDPMLMAAIKLQQEKPKQRFVQDKRTSLAIDSRTRDTTMYLYQNNYKINLRQEFSNIISVRMKDAIFVNTQQLIKETPLSQKNNVIQWNIEDDITGTGGYHIYTASITPGNYTETTLATEIKNQMNSIVRSDGTYNNFSVSIDTVTDIVSFTSVSYTTLSNPFSFSVPGTGVSYTEVTVVWNSHGFSNVGTRIYMEDVSFVTSGGLSDSSFNTNHVITEIIDTNSFKFRIQATATANVSDDGGTSVKIGSGLDFQLLFSEDNSPASIIGFDEVDTGFAVEHQNTTETFNYVEQFDEDNISLGDTARRIKINKMTAGDYTEITLIRTELPHLLTTGDRIYLYDSSSVPSGSTILDYDHFYGLDSGDLTSDENNTRKSYVAQLTDPSGLIVTVISSNEITVPIKYESIASVETDVALVDDDDTFGDIIIKDKNVAIDLGGEKYIFMCSPQIGGDMIDTSGNVSNVFAKIQLAGTANSTIFNAYSGGTKVFYDNPLSALEEIEFFFRTQDNVLFEFNDKNHSFVLEITEAVQKLEGSGLSARIGARI